MIGKTDSINDVQRNCVNGVFARKSKVIGEVHDKNVGDNTFDRVLQEICDCQSVSVTACCACIRIFRK